MKIGIMGGTFDPIHVGHLIAAEQAREAIALDEVWFIPVAAAPHKDNIPEASTEQRLEMLKRAIRHHAKFKANDLEIVRGGRSYTIDTIKELKERYPDVDFHYIIGADMVEYLPKWHRIDELAQLVTFIGLQRPGFNVALGELPVHLRERVILAPMPLIDISSTEIKKWRKLKRSIRYLVPESVHAYIEEHSLYES
jgi:nicotinate-nucleotide adenylyltransferase